MKSFLAYSATFRTNCLATLPMVAVAGAALGAAVAQSDGSPAYATMLWFAAALSVASYVSAILEAGTLQLLRIEAEGIYADGVSLGWDLILGGITGAFLASITEVTLLEAAGVASAILFMQRLIMEKLLLGNVVGDTFTRLLQGSGGTEPEYSRADAFAARGEFEAARLEFESAIASAPQQPRPYLAFARMLRDVQRDYCAAAKVLERALTLPRLDERTRAIFTRELAELYLHRLDRAGRAATLLARFVATADQSQANWARSLLGVAKSELKLTER